MSFTFNPQAKTRTDSSGIIGVAVMWIEVIGMKDCVRIKAAVAKPFGCSRKAGVIRIAQIIWIIFAPAQPFLEIKASYFIIILNRLRIVLLWLDPFPCRSSSFLPGLIDNPGAGELSFDLSL